MDDFIVSKRFNALIQKFYKIRDIWETEHLCPKHKFVISFSTPQYEYVTYFYASLEYILNKKIVNQKVKTSNNIAIEIEHFFNTILEHDIRVSEIVIPIPERTVDTEIDGYHHTFDIRFIIKKILDEDFISILNTDQIIFNWSKKQKEFLMELINKSMPTGISHTDLIAKSRRLAKEERKILLTELLSYGLIEIHENKEMGRIKKIYKASLPEKINTGIKHE